MANNYPIFLIIGIIGIVLLFFFQPTIFGAGAVLPSGQYSANNDCSFITNVALGDSYKQNTAGSTIGAWVALDNGMVAGKRGFGYSGYSSFSCTQTGAIMLPFKTPEGYDVCSRTGYDNRVYVRYNNEGLIFETNEVEAQSAILNCGTTTTQPSVTTTQPVTTTLPGQVCRAQLGQYIQSWVTSGC